MTTSSVAESGALSAYDDLSRFIQVGVDHVSLCELLTLKVLLEQIRVAVDALKQISGLPRPPGTRRANRQVLDWDILDWLESTFGFQVRMRGAVLMVWNSSFKMLIRQQTRRSLVTQSPLSDAVQCFVNGW